MRRLYRLALLVVFAAIPACGQTAGGQNLTGQQQATTEFGRLIQRLSEPGGYFDTDNLISNETSYLHVMGKMRELGISGGAYLGVGPGQNFSYMAQIRPDIALLVDIRRDNLLQHFLFKALFELSGTRIEYLAMLTGRPVPDGATAWTTSSIQRLVDYIDTTPSAPAILEEYQRAVTERVAGFGLPLSESDYATIEGFHDTFVYDGLGLRFNTFGRAPQSYYPTLRELLLEADLTGRQANYLTREEDFQFLKSLQERDLVVPVVGDLAGTHALQAIGEYLAEIDEGVSAFYTSNVEFYLMGNGSFDSWADNLVRLPRLEPSLIIRSYFGGRFRFRHPQAVSGYYSVQLLQRIEDFAADHEAGAFRSYLDVVTNNSLVLR